jgi:DNA-binding NarL/FixJ family response regulator
MLTVYDDTERLLEAIKAGAQGYLLKNIRSAELLDQLGGLAAGEAPIARRMATRMLGEFRRGHDQQPAGPEAELTARELQVLELVAARLRNKEIAERLVISEHTVKNHLKNILATLHLRSRRQAAADDLARGWVQGPGFGRVHQGRTAPPHPAPRTHDPARPG